MGERERERERVGENFYHCQRCGDRTKVGLYFADADADADADAEVVASKFMLRAKIL